MILAPLRGVTIRCFRRVFASAIIEAGFTEAVTPFIPANAGCDPLKDRELKPGKPEPPGILLVPQFIGKDPKSLEDCLRRVKDAGYAMADLNCGCPFPMVRKKGRGSGLLSNPDNLFAMVETGCRVMGPDAFSIKTRLGISRNDGLLTLMPRLNDFPLRRICVHARTAVQMYDGGCDREASMRVEAACLVPFVRNGDLEPDGAENTMCGRAFIRSLAGRSDIRELLYAYAEESAAEGLPPRAVLGRLKELVAYWRDTPSWKRAWLSARLARSPSELLSLFTLRP